MKYLIKILICIPFILAGQVIVFAQKCEKPADADYEIEEVAIREKEAEREWYEVRIKDVSFYLPNNLKEREASCFDGGCNVFENSETSMLIDRDAAAYHPNWYDRENLTYTQKVFCMDGNLAWFWTYHDGIKYYTGVYFFFKADKRRRFGMYFNSKNNDIFQIAEKAVKSIEFIKSN